MSAETNSNDGQKRLGRLKSMQAKHVQSPPAAAAAPAGGQGILNGLLVGGAAGGQGEGAGAGSIQQRLRKALSGPDGKIDQKKARMFLMMVRKQAADPAAPRHEMAKKIAEKLKTMPAHQRQRLMAMAGLGAGGLGGNGEGAAAQDGQAPTGEAWFDKLVEKF